MRVSTAAVTSLTQWLRNTAKGDQGGVAKMWAKNGNMLVQATNYATFAHGIIPVDGDLPEIVVELRPIFGFLRGVDADIVEIIAESRSTLRLAAGRTTLSLPMADIITFPDFSIPDDMPRIPVRPLVSLIERARWAAADYDERPTLAGVYMSASDGVLRGVSGNGRILCDVEAIIPNDFSLQNVLCPSEFLDLLLKIPGLESESEHEGSVTTIGFGVHQNKIVASTSTNALACPLLANAGVRPTFPEIRPVSRWRLDLDVIQTALRPLRGLPQELNFKFTPSGTSEITISTGGPYKATTVIPAEVDGPYFPIMLHYDKSLASLLDLGGAVEIWIENAYSPILLKRGTDHYLLMPLRF